MKQHKQRPYRLHRLPVVLCCLSPLASALAQTSEQTGTTYPPVEVRDTVLEYRQFEKVEITGSSIVRKEQTQALPVQVITRQELQKRGHTTLTDAVQTLSNVFNGMDITQMGMNMGGYTSAALHGMPNGTLVLLNGKRLAPYGIQTISGKEKLSIDLDMLPLSAVERIEVLSDGASSLYGTDAIAGVINIITRSEMNGVEVAVDFVQPKGGAGQGRIGSLNWGRGKLQKDGYSLRVSAELESHDPVGVTDRPYAGKPRIGFDYSGKSYEIDSPRVTSYTSPAWIYSPDTARQMYSPLYQNGACTGNSVSYKGFQYGCKTNLMPTFDIYPGSNSRKLHAMGEVLLPNASTLYGELLYSQYKSQMAINSWSTTSGRIINKEGSVGYAEMVALGMDPSYGFYFWQPDLAGLRQQFDKTQLRTAIGIKGEWESWNYHANLYQTQSKAVQTVEKDDLTSAGVIGQGGLSNPLMLQPLNAQNPLTAQLLNSRWWQQDALGRTTLTAAELRASRPWFEIDGKDVMLGWGVEARQEKVSSQFSSDAGKTTASSGGDVPSFDGQRRVYAAYGELQLPVTSTWDVITSLRHDRYSDVGSTTNGKLASRWAISPQWAMRGSVGTGFRAPSIGQVQTLASQYKQSEYNMPSCSDALVAKANALAASSGLDVVCLANMTMKMLSNGNPDLKPEQSRQASVGLSFTPSRNLSISADYWRVEMRDTLQFESRDDVLANPGKYPNAFVIDPEVHLLNNGQIRRQYLALYLQMKNMGQSIKEGIDIDVRYRQPSDWGRWLIGAQASYILTSKEKANAQAEWIADLAAFSTLTELVTPRWRGKLMFGLEQAKTQWQLNVNYTSGYTDKTILAQNMETLKKESVVGRPVPEFITADVMAMHQLTRMTQIRMGVTNVFDSQPPLSFYSLTSAVWGVNSQNGNLLGRTVQIGLTHKF